MDPRWLDDHERAAWLRFVMLLELMPGLLDTQLRRDSGISHFEYFVLAMLSESHQARMRMTDLATMTNATLPRLSHVVSRLEERELVRREPVEDDRRVTVVVLTGGGRAKVDDAAPGHVDHVRTHVVDALSDEQLGQLTEICDAMLARIPAAQSMLRTRADTLEG